MDNNSGLNKKNSVEIKKDDKRVKRRLRKEDSRIKRKKIFKRIGLSILTLFLVVLVSGGSLLGIIFFKSKDDISNHIKNAYSKVSNINNNTFNSRHSTKILDKNKKLIKEFKIANYKYSKYDEVNSLVYDSFIAIEDPNFYKHSGVDYFATFKAITNTIIYKLTEKGNLRGGSTITQQLVKNVFLTNDQTVWRKLEEMVIAQELEDIYSKENILEFYVNNIYFGHGIYGIETASDFFFKKKTKDLELWDIVALASIPNNPTTYDPINNPDNVVKRRNRILDSMFEKGFISEEDLNNSKSKELKLNVRKISFDNSVKDYDLDFALQKSTEYLMKYKGFQFRYAFNTNKEREEYFKHYNKSYSDSRQELISGGYIIETSIDREKQKKLQSIIDNQLSGFYAKNNKNGLYKRQASATLINNENGEVEAIVGGRSQDGNTFNRASLGARQPGSTMKPFVYTMAFENGYYPDYIYEDKAIKGGPYNWYSGYKGNVPLRYAVEISINTIPYRLADTLGAVNLYQNLANMQFKYLTPQDKNAIIALGGFTKGVTTTELSSAYSTLARNGEFIEPTNVRKVTTIGTDEKIFENTHTKTRIFDSGASYLMTDTLKGVINEKHGTGKRAKIDYKYQAGKTGTTDKNKDTWFAGYTPYYTMTVWSGEDTPTTIYSGLDIPKNIWKQMMNYLHLGLKEKDFEKPKNVYTENGKLKVKIESDNEEMLRRKANEDKRKDAEIAEQLARLEEEEYRIKYGLSEEEENNREKIAENMLEELSKFNYSSLKKENDLRKIILDTKNSIDNVKRKSANKKYMEQYYSYVNNFNRINDQLVAEAEAKRREEEAKRREEEEEKRRQEELEQFIKDEENNLNDSIDSEETYDNTNLEETETE